MNQRFWLKSNRIRQFLDSLEPPDSLVLVTSALVIGVGTGLGAVIFIRLLSQIHHISLLAQEQLGSVAGLFLFMALAGLVVGFMVDRWASEAKGHGVPEVMEALALRGGRIRPRVAAVKVLASSVTIGAGGSAGREGPIVQVGSALGSTLGQLLHFSAERVRTLVACGAAAGIAATFNAPIAGSIFALEVILGKFTVRYFGAVVMSSVAASIVGRIFLGDKPAFAVPAYALHSLWELPIYVVLGVLAALVAVLFIRSLYALEGLFDNWSWPLPFKTSVGMLLTAAVSLFLPGREVLGPGLEFIGETIAEDFSLSLQLMATLLVLKLVATCFTLGSGNSGGVFAPGLFMGAVLGGMVGGVAQTIWPAVVVNPGAYAIVGMAAVFSGAARAPITAVLIVFEMSNDYKLILPLMLATVLSTLLAEHLFSESIYTLKLKLKGITLQRGRDLDIMQNLLVRDAMTRDPYMVPHDMPIEQLAKMLQQTHSHSFPVVDDELNLVGMVSLHDLERAAGQPDGRPLRVKDIATMGSVIKAYDDEPLSSAIQRLAIRGINKMPVVTRDEPHKVIGTIRRNDIVKAYNIALARRAQGDLDEETLRPNRLEQDEGLEFVEIEITSQSPAVNRTLASLGPELPYDCVIISVKREGHLLIPHGDTVLYPGDVVKAFVRRVDEGKLEECLLGRVKKKPEISSHSF
ncbi:MAG: CBS domain-containing protein [Chloroflexi bacterium]|nr:MAG: CBS domain-containing protein [Chloroflexota bacterium]